MWATQHLAPARLNALLAEPIVTVLSSKPSWLGERGKCLFPSNTRSAQISSLTTIRSCSTAISAKTVSSSWVYT